MALVVVSLVGSMSGCDTLGRLAKQTVDASSPELRQYDAAPPVDREAYGLRPLPATGTVDIEQRHGASARRAGYDVMLHFYRSGFTKTVALRKRDGRWVWVGEQDGHTGPLEYDSVDGRLRERIFIGYNLYEGLGVERGPRVSYFGDREALSGPLTLADVEPVLREWDASAGTHDQ